MKVTKVTVSASSGFNHPYEDYANFRPAVTLEAEIEQDDSWGDVVKYLQGKAEKLVQDQKQEILDDL
ncbi:MAG: hypothetical protein KDA77_11280, partial [Planctomycetaceae bacterium]|nr:hypothetical protein [Planctomycetaceae bacterium]